MRNINAEMVEARNSKRQIRDALYRTKSELVQFLTASNALKGNIGVAGQEFSQSAVMDNFLRHHGLIAMVLNNFTQVGNLHVGLFWMPAKKNEELQEHVRKMEREHKLHPILRAIEPPQELVPPTYFEENDFCLAG